MQLTISEKSYRPLNESLGEYGRGIAGGLIFSMPLLYTMELWHIGHRVEPMRLFTAAMATFIVLLGYNRYAGLRSDASRIEIIIDSVEELGIGLVLSAIILWLMGLIGNQQPLESQIERLVVEALLAAIGVSVGTAQLNNDDQDSGLDNDKDQDSTLGSNLTLSVCGALLLATAIAPTDEIPQIAATSSAPRLIAMLGLCILLAFIILRYDEQSEATTTSTKENTLAAALVTVSVALLVSAALLWFFKRFDAQPLHVCLTQTIVLCLPSSLGAAAGRLLLE